MRKILRNRLALSTVVTTLIILVVSVLLAGVVTYFAINVVSTRVQQESVQLTFAHIWVSASGNSQAAVLVKNIGGRDIVINQITVRGIAGTYGTNVFTKVASTNPLALAATTGLTNTTASTPITLASGSSMQVYITDPTSVSIQDVGTTVGITVFTAQAIYYQETNVQTTTVALP